MTSLTDADIVFNSAFTWDVHSGGGSARDFRRVATHELGHALGLDHSSSSAALMYAFYSDSIEVPQADDIAGLRAIYGNSSSANLGMSVTGSNTTFTGPQGGQFNPTLAWYSLSVTGCQNPNFENCNVNFRVDGKPDWLSMSPLSGGILIGQGGTTVDYQVNDTGRAKAPGTYTANISIVNTTNGRGNANYTVTLIVGTAGPPAAPTATPATNVTSSGFQANWNSVSGATGYRLDVATDIGFSNLTINNFDAGNGTGATISGVPAGVIRYYRVRAYNGSGTSGNSNTISVTTTGTAIAAPSATSATNITSNSYQANWTSVSGATGYRIDVAYDSAFTNFALNNYDRGAATSLVVGGLPANTTTYYRVRAYNGSGASANSNTVSATTGVSLAAPAATSATNITSNSYQANWTSVSGATGYRIDVAYDTGFTNIALGNYDVGAATSLVIGGLQANTTTYYRVRAYNGTGTSSNSNTVSASTSGATPPPAPTANPAANVTSTSFTASWSSVAGATGYRIDLATDAGFTALLQSNADLANNTAFNALALNSNTTYYYRVRAYNNAGASGNSNTVSVTTSGGSGPANDLFANAVTIAAGQTTLSGSNVNATKEAGEPNIVNNGLSGDGGGKSVWWRCTAGASGSATITTFGSGFDTLLGVYTGSAVNALTQIAGNDDASSGTTSQVTFSAVAGTTYRIVVDGYGGASGAITLNLSNLSCSGAGSRNTHDLDGNGKSDIIWRDSAGNAVVWFMNASAVAGTGAIASIDNSWQIVGQRDFDGGGKSDILWRNSSGATAIWLMNGASIASSASLGTIAGTWSVVGTRDMDGDGKGDILWRDTSGNVAAWFMNGTSVKSSTLIGTVPSPWSIVTSNDFDGDGKADILWRDTSGNTSIWFMNAGTVTSSSVVGTVPSPWSIVATADFDGNGKADILWRDTSGNTAIWLMNGASIAASAAIGTVAPTWFVAQTGDYDGDGKTDILWRDGSGNTAIWFMNGTTVVSSSFLASVPNTWTIEAKNAD